MRNVCSGAVRKSATGRWALLASPCCRDVPSGVEFEVQMLTGLSRADKAHAEARSTGSCALTGLLRRSRALAVRLGCRLVMEVIHE
jgi:hypothetical protein